MSECIFLLSTKNKDTRIHLFPMQRFSSLARNNIHSAPPSFIYDYTIMLFSAAVKCKTGRKTSPTSPNLRNNLMLQPLLTVKTAGKDNRPDAPVRKHANPDCHWSEVEGLYQKYAQTDPAYPHGSRGYQHGKLNVSGRSHAICRNKGQYP